MTLSPWHPMSTPPEHRGRYQVRYHNGETAYRVWKGCWCKLPTAFVREWRGVSR